MVSHTPPGRDLKLLQASFVVLFKDLFREFRGKLLLCAVLSILTGLSNGLLLVITSEVIGGEERRVLVAMGAFFGMLITWGILRHYTSVGINGIIETLIVRLRALILGDLQDCELESFERIGREGIHNALTEDCTTISRFVPDLVDLVSAAITIIVCLIYLVWLSLPAVLLILGLLGICLPLYLLRQQSAKMGLSASRSQIDVIYSFILDFLHGFKELKVNRAKRNDLFGNHLLPGFEVTRSLRIGAHKSIQLNYSLGIALFFIYLSVVLFYFPVLYPDDPDVVARVAVISLYLIVPGSTFLYGALQMVSLKVAMENIEALHYRIRVGRPEYSRNGNDAPRWVPEDFEKLQLEGIRYRYPDSGRKTPFSIGPISWELSRGRIHFITGGNGSGKTTLLKVISGLYLPQEGGIRVDGRVVEGPDFEGYRGLFSPVFSDFHLFDRLYGNDALAPAMVHGWLERFGLSEKVVIEEGRLSTTNLSSGQRRRLALLAAVLEERPVLILDEVTADQELEFREYFYSEFLPTMKKEGRTIVIITHDDRYFSSADELLKLEYGRVVDEGPRSGDQKMKTAEVWS